MCEYCKIDSFAKEDLVFKKMKFGFFGDGDLSVYLSEEDDGIKLIGSLASEHDIVWAGETKINYCPMCGRKLDEQEVEHGEAD